MDRILEPETLAAQLAAHPETLLIHVAAAAAYAAGHIDGAVHVAPAELVSGKAPATGQLPDLARLEELFSRIGYRTDAPIVVYDDEGGGWAGRFIWTLDVIGHHDWFYLNGGIHAWARPGRRCNRPPCDHSRRACDSRSIALPIADAPDILDRLGDASVVVWDCRSADEFAGRRPTAARNGHIPGAVHLDWLDLMDPDRAAAPAHRCRRVARIQGDHAR